MKLSTRLIMIPAGISAMLLGCAPEPESRAQNARMTGSRDEIARYLQAKVDERALAYPGAKLTDLRFNDDLSMVCGRIEYPGEPPLLFMSIDNTLQTLERPILMPKLHLADEWHHQRTAKQQEDARTACERAGVRL